MGKELKVIIKTAHVTSETSKGFVEMINEAVNMVQQEGLTVDIQYQPVPVKDRECRVIYTALVIGRKEEVQ